MATMTYKKPATKGSGKKKKYALYIYQPDKEGYSRWHFVMDIETDNPEKFVDDYFFKVTDQECDAVFHFYGKHKINGIWYNNMINACLRGENIEEVVLVERLND